MKFKGAVFSYGSVSRMLTIKFWLNSLGNTYRMKNQNTCTDFKECHKELTYFTVTNAMEKHHLVLR